MKMKAYASFDEYLADQAAKNRDLIRALRQFVKRVAPSLEESVKWGNGCWIQRKAPVAYVYSAPDHVQFGFFAGSALKDPDRLLQGQGKFVRHIKLVKRSDIDEKSFAALLRQAARQERTEPSRPRKTSAAATDRRSSRPARTPRRGT